MIYPSFLTNGSTIGICAPSAGAGKDLESFDACLDKAGTYHPFYG